MRWSHFDRSVGRWESHSSTAALRTYSSHFEHAAQQTTTDESGNSDADVLRFLKYSCCVTKGYQFWVEEKLSLCTHRHRRYYFQMEFPECGQVVDQMNNKFKNTLTSSVAHTRSWANLLGLFRMCDYDYERIEKKNNNIAAFDIRNFVPFSRARPNVNTFAAHSHTATAEINYLASL